MVALALIAVSAEETMAPVTHKVYLDVDIDGKDAGRITIGLFGTVVPETVHNFVDIAAGYVEDREGNVLTYSGNKFHRIIPHFMAQGGDITKGDGTGGISIFGKKFPDENFILKHERDHVVSMANSGADTNGSQFFITFQKTPWLDGKHVVFGEVIDGFETLHKMEAQGTPKGTPKKSVVIRQAGVIDEALNF